MGKIVVTNLNHLSIESNETERSILNILHNNGVDWMHACGAKGRCTTCKMIILNEKHELSSVTPFEQKYIDRGLLREGERLTCQTKLLSGTLSVKVPESSKLPHLKYTDN